MSTALSFKKIALLALTVSSVGPCFAGEIVFSDATSAVEKARAASATEMRLDPVQVELFTGNARLDYIDVHIPGNGGLDLEVRRVYDLSIHRKNIWNCVMISGTSCPQTPPFETAPFSYYSSSNAWSLTVAPILSIQEAWPVLDWRDTDDMLCAGVEWGTPHPQNPEVIWPWPSAYYSVTLPDGQEEALHPFSPGVAMSKKGWKLTCVGGVNGTHYLFSPTGIKYTLDVRGGVSQVASTTQDPLIGVSQRTASRAEDLNGNWIQFHYTKFFQYGIPSLTGITTSDSRSLTFNYEHYVVYPGYPETAPRIESISSDGTVIRKYRYVNGLLSEVEAPGAAVWKYEYWPVVEFDGKNSSLVTNVMEGGTHRQPNWAKSGALRRVTVPLGGSIELDYAPSPVSVRRKYTWEIWEGEGLCHDYYMYPCEEYDPPKLWHTQVISQVLSDGRKWSYTYQPGVAAGSFDTTTVVSPSAVETHKFYGNAWFLGSPNKWRSKTEWIYRESWRYGLRHQVSVGASRSETTSWAGIVFSELGREYISAPLYIYDRRTWIPAIASRTIVNDGLTYSTTYSDHDRWGNARTIIEKGPGGAQRTISREFYFDEERNIIGKLKSEKTVLNAQ